jgi:hypothetical protein
MHQSAPLKDAKGCELVYIPRYAPRRSMTEVPAGLVAGPVKGTCPADQMVPPATILVPLTLDKSWCRTSQNRRGVLRSGSSDTGDGSRRSTTEAHRPVSHDNAPVAVRQDHIHHAAVGTEVVEVVVRPTSRQHVPTDVQNVTARHSRANSMRACWWPMIHSWPRSWCPSAHRQWDACRAAIINGNSCSAFSGRSCAVR